MRHFSGRNLTMAGCLRAMGRSAKGQRSPESAGLSRRSLLAGAAALGASALVTYPIRAAVGARGSVAVVGAGLAGLVSAYRLLQAGVQADVFEASDRVGGRVFTAHQTFAAGQYVERGGEWINTTHTRMIALLRELGLVLEPYYSQSDPDAEDLIWVNGQAYETRQLADDLSALSRVARLQAAQIRGQYTYDTANAAAVRIDSMGAAEWIERYVPGGGIHSNLGEWLKNLLVVEMGAQPEEISGLLPYWLATSLTLGAPVPGSGATLFTTRGGNQGIVDSLYQRLAPGQVSTGRWLTAARTLSDGRIELHFDTASGPSTRVYDRVVFALPLNTLKEVDLSAMGLPALRTQLINELSLGANTKLQLQFSQRLWYGQGSTGTVAGEVPFQSSYEPTVHQAGVPGILTSYLGGQGAVAAGEMSADAAAQAFLEEIEVFLPGLGAAYTGRATLDSWHHAPTQRGAYCNYGPGQITRFYGYADAPHGAAHFAGEYTSFEFWGYMEGAVESGERAAREVLGALGLA